MLIYRMTSRREAQLGVCTPWATSFGDSAVSSKTVSTKNAPHGRRPG
jgi:hypothetical protein